MATSNPTALLARLLRENSEKPWLEFKQNRCIPDELGKYVSACANAALLAEQERAYIVFGIEDKTLRRIGTNVRLGEIKKGSENLANWLCKMLAPRPMMEFLDFEDGGKQFAILTIDSSYERPVSFAGTEYIRVGENLRTIKDFPEHERALWFATGRRKFEGALALSHQTPDAVLSLLSAEKYYELAGEEKPKNVDEIIRRFTTCGFVKDDMEGGFDVTNLGAILLANDISDFPSISAKSVRVIEYVGADKQKSKREIEGRKGYAVGFKGLMQFILNRLPRDEVYSSGVRSTVPVYPETAIREIIANALIHQDFTVTGAGPVIEIYSDRIEVINPGNSLIEVDRIIDERRSRNEKLASAMRALGLCEERGGGIDKAIIEVERKSLPAPKFYPSENSMRVVIFGPKEFKQLSKADKIWACFCHCVVRWLTHDYMNNTSLRQRFSLDVEEYQTVSAVIAAAKKENRIVPAEKDQGNRYARYIPYWAG